MFRKQFNLCAIGIAIMGLTASTSLDTQAAVTFRTIALTVQQAPGTDYGVTFSQLSAPQLVDSEGRVTFSASLAGPGVDNSNCRGLWSEQSGSLNLIARTGDAVPGTTPGVSYTRLYDSALNSSGQIALQGYVTGPGVDETNDVGIWVGTADSLNLIARKGNTLPGLNPSETFNNLSDLRMNDAGQVIFSDTLVRDYGGSLGIVLPLTVIEQRLWMYDSGSLQLILQKDDPAPGMDPSMKMTRFTPSAFNGSGQVALLGQFGTSAQVGTGIIQTTHYGSGIWTGSAGSLTPVALTNEHAPGTEAGVEFSDLYHASFNNAGQVAFWGRLVGTGVDDTNKEGIWSNSSGSLSLIAREGDQAPGTEAGVVFHNPTMRPVINSAGQVVFTGGLTGPGVDLTNNRGIWLEDAGSLNLVVRRGDPAPGTAPGEVFDGLHSPAINAAGQLVFGGSLTGPGVDHTNEDGLWAMNLDRTIELIAREGDLFDVNADPLIVDLRVIERINFSSSANGGNLVQSSFSDAGKIAFSLSFTDGSSGVFVASLNPEPGTAVTFTLLTTMLLRRRGDYVLIHTLPACRHIAPGSTG